MRTTKWIAGMVAAALVLVGGPETLWAQQRAKQATQPDITDMVDRDQPGVLKGLKGVGLIVWVEGRGLAEESADAKKIGLTKGRLQSSIESSLRRNKVRMLTRDERWAAPGCPALHINVDVVGAAYSINVGLTENALLERAPGTLVTGATTWSRNSVGTHGGSADLIVKEAEKLVDTFCLDYRKANPK